MDSQHLLQSWEGPEPLPNHITVVVRDPGDDLGIAACLRVAHEWVANPVLYMPR